MNAQQIIILIVALLGNSAIAETFDQPRLTGLMWTIFQAVTVAVLWGIFTILTA
jgi:hypothetical protein